MVYLIHEIVKKIIKIFTALPVSPDDDKHDPLKKQTLVIISWLETETFAFNLAKMYLHFVQDTCLEQLHQHQIFFLGYLPEKELGGYYYLEEVFENFKKSYAEILNEIEVTGKLPQNIAYALARTFLYIYIEVTSPELIE